MDIISILLIGIGLAMDAFSVSVSEGIILKKPTLGQSAKIALFFGIFQFIMPCIGYLLGSAFADYITAFDHYIAFVLLGFIGGKMIYEAICEKEEGEIKNPLSFNTLLVLAIATSIDALAVGVSFAFLKVDIWISVLLIGITTCLFSMVGINIGNFFGSRFKSTAELLGGIILVVMGVKILIEHTLL